MYKIKKSFGIVNEPETWATEVIGIYKSLDDAVAAADSEFDAIMERLGDKVDELRIDCVEAGYGDHYVTYGRYDCELGCGVADHYYRVYVVETMR